MKDINFITNQSLNNTSGGWSGISYNIYKNLEQRTNVNYLGPVAPQMVFSEKLFSKTKRTVGLKGNFSFFSDKRLRKIREIVEEKKQKANYNLFFGQTPWIDCNFAAPYGVYMDADFSTYLRIYSNPKSFSKKDIQRITQKEEKWLQSAKNIFVGSQWTWDEMTKIYDLDESKKTIVWTGGNVEIPKKDTYSGDLIFTFISLDFLNKGGEIAVKAFLDIKKQFPSAVLKILGQEPPVEYRKLEGISYEGYLRKTVPEEYEKFVKILSESFMMIHPTTMDTMGAVIIESGYHGCPTIAPKSFGIPELILDNKTGIVVDLPFDNYSFSNKIISLIKNKQDYYLMRQNVREHTTGNFTWNEIGNKIFQSIQ